MTTSGEFVGNWEWCIVHHGVRGRRKSGCVEWFLPERGVPERCRFVPCAIEVHPDELRRLAAEDGRLL